MDKIIFDKNRDIRDFTDFRNYKADIKAYSLRIADFIISKRFLIHPDFQREYVWPIKKASTLIETILLSLPIPGIYTYINLGTGQEIVIDGQQRLTTIKKFINNGFELQGLKKLSHLNNLKFYQLPDEYKNRLLTSDLYTVSLENISSKNIIYDIFERFNNGGVKLNSQEIRNCIYGGQFNDFIKSLAKDKDFQSLIKKFEPKRYIAEELCVRFMALYDKLHLYKGNMKNFLNNYYEEKQFLDDFSKIDFENYVKENKKTFIDCILACKIVFEQNAFKKINKYEHPVNGKTFEYGSFSKMVFDMQMLGFASFDLASVRRNAEKIREKYIQILLKYPEMEPCTKNNKSTAARIKKWQDCIGKIINE